MDATIALCMIVRDPAEGLETCLMSVKDLVDEIRIVSTHNHYTDEIISICHRVFGSWHPKLRVLFCDCKCEGCDINTEDTCFDLAKARNLSFKDVESYWILWLDADDYVSPDNCKMIRDLVNKYYDQGSDGPKSVLFTYDYDANTQLMRERLIRNEHKDDLWIMPVHECICYSALGSYENHPEVHITHCRQHSHNAERNLYIFEKAIENKLECINDYRFIFYYAETLLIDKRYKEAIEQFDRLVCGTLWAGDRFRYCLDCTECLKNLPTDNKHDRSGYIKKLIFDWPECAEGYYELGIYHKRNLNWHKSIAAFKNCIRPVPQKEFAVNKSLYNWKPMEEIYKIYSHMKDYNNAIEWALRCRASLPEGLNVDADIEFLASKVSEKGKRELGIDLTPIVTDYGVAYSKKWEIDKKKLKVGFVNVGSTDLPSIRMRTQAVFENMGKYHDDIECKEIVMPPKNMNSMNTIADVIVMGLPYDYSYLMSGLPIIVDYPEDLLGVGSTYDEEQKEELNRFLNNDLVKAIVVSSPKLAEQVPEGKAVYIPEMAMDARHD